MAQTLEQFLSGNRTLPALEWAAAKAMAKGHPCGSSDWVGDIPGPYSNYSPFDVPPDVWIFTIQPSFIKHRPRPYGGGRFSLWARDSALAMLKEHDDRIRRGGGLPDLAMSPGRQALIDDYYATSLNQFCQDAANQAAGKPFIELEAKDGLKPYPPQELERLRFAQNLSAQKELDQSIINAGVFSDLTDRELVEISRILPTDPIAQNILESIVDESFPATGEEFAILFPQLDESELAALSAQLTPEATNQMPDLDPDAQRVIIDDPSLPIQPGNVLGPDAAAEIIGRELGAIVHQEAGNYRTDEQEAMQDQRSLEELAYWKANGPQVKLRPEDNAFLEPSLLTHKWRAQWGPAPLVNVWVLPQERPKPELGFIAEIMQSPFSVLLNAIPVIGTVAYVGLQAGAMAQMQSFISDYEVPKSAFEPQYDPVAFTLPFPLDWAQFAVKRPEYFPAMYERFQRDILTGKLENANDVWQSLGGGPVNIPNYWSDSVQLGPVSNRSGLITGNLSGTGGEVGQQLGARLPDGSAPAQKGGNGVFALAALAAGWLALNS